MNNKAELAILKKEEQIVQGWIDGTNDQFLLYGYVRKLEEIKTKIKEYEKITDKK